MFVLLSEMWGDEQQQQQQQSSLQHVHARSWQRWRVPKSIPTRPVLFYQLDFASSILCNIIINRSSSSSGGSRYSSLQPRQVGGAFTH